MKRASGPRETAKQETRQRLMKAAQELFALEGLDVPSLDAICARAGYTRGAFYVHFEDRDALVAAVMEDVLGRFLAGVLGPGDQADGVEGTVARFVDALSLGAVPMLEDRSLHFHHVLAAASRSPRIRERFVTLVTQAVGHLGQDLKRAQRRGLARKGVHAEQVATMLVAAALGLLAMMEAGIAFQPDALRRTVVNLLKPPMQ